MSQPAIPCPHCGQAVALTPAQTAAALESAKYVRTIAAERRTGGRLPADDPNPANTIPFMRHPGEHFYSARYLQAITEREENR